jgi:hypothetical protein
MVWPILDDAQSTALKEIVKTQSDRVAAIVGGAMLDDSLQLSIKARLRESDLANRLFDIRGALRNLGPKIDLAYLLRIIEEDDLQAMSDLVEIRNLFTHILSASFSASSNRLDEAFSKLALHQGKTHYPSSNEGDPTWPFEDVSTRHGVWIVNLKLCLSKLRRDSEKQYTWEKNPVNLMGQKDFKPIKPTRRK